MRALFPKSELCERSKPKNSSDLVHNILAEGTHAEPPKPTQNQPRTNHVQSMPRTSDFAIKNEFIYRFSIRLIGLLLSGVAEGAPEKSAAKWHFRALDVDFHSNHGHPKSAGFPPNGDVSCLKHASCENGADVWRDAG